MSLPTLFISHGSPALVLEPSPARDFLAGLGAQARRPEAILAISAHYTAPQVMLTSARAPATIHDFGGFPEALYRMTYPAPGAPELAMRVAELLRAGGAQAGLDETRGLDHGAWAPLTLMYPSADIPVVQMSLTGAEDPAFYEGLGKLLRPLRDEGVLVLASGSASHNLQAYFAASPSAPTPVWVEAFTHWLARAIEGNDRKALRDYRTQAPFAARNHPTQEHFLPLFIALGAAGDEEPGRRIHVSHDRGVMAMDAFAWGMPTA